MSIRKSSSARRRLISQAAAASLLGVARHTLAGWLRKRRAGVPRPVRYHARCLRFFEDEILAYREKCREVLCG